MNPSPFFEIFLQFFSRAHYVIASYTFPISSTSDDPAPFDAETGGTTGDG